LVPKLYPFAKERLADRLKTEIMEDKAPAHVSKKAFAIIEASLILFCIHKNRDLSRENVSRNKEFKSGKSYAGRIWLANTPN
jgi:hypothetical protein